MLSNQCVQSGDALQPFRQPGPGQTTTTLIDDLDVVMILSPVDSDEQHPRPAPFK